MKQYIIFLCCSIVLQLSMAKPGDYSVGGDFASDIGAAYPGIAAESPGLITADLKPASTAYDFGYGSPPEPIVPYFPIRNYGWGWKPQPVIAPFPVYPKPIQIPILPLGWGGWQGGIF